MGILFSKAMTKTDPSNISLSFKALTSALHSAAAALFLNINKLYLLSTSNVIVKSIKHQLSWLLHFLSISETRYPQC